ncbi:MAG: hypothetical protein WCK98_04500 [bacterium]
MSDSQPQSQQQPESPKKIKSSTIFSWIFGIIFILAALSAFASSFISGLFYLFAGLYILPPVHKLIFKKLGFILPGWTTVLIVIVLLSIGGLSSSSKNSSSTNSSSSNSTIDLFQNKQEKIELTNSLGQKVTVDKNDSATVEGVPRKELEETYNNISKTQSKFKADEYKKSLIGKTVTWTVKVTNVDTSIDGRPYINFKSGGIYTIRGYDDAKKYVDLNKGSLVAITGKIEDIYDFIGVDVYIKLDNVVAI